MDRLIAKYADKLVAHELCASETMVFGALDADLSWNREASEQEVLKAVIDGLNINTILFAPPQEPYFTIINFLVQTNPATIFPGDCETRTFLHDIPVAAEFSATSLIEALKKRKSVIIPGKGLVTVGTVSPEQAFVVFSSVCFACFVKLFLDYLLPSKTTDKDSRLGKFLCDTAKHYKTQVNASRQLTPLAGGPFLSDQAVIDAMIQAGKRVVDARLVDSFFGNISCLYDDTLYISQTGSSLDELAGVIDVCPMDGSSCAAVTASSELTAHRNIYETMDCRTILHGHPRFSVIMSMYCTDCDCENRGQCHIKCSRPRFVNDIPIVPGEVGTGRYGLCHTLPPAVKDARGAIVHSHGLFTTGQDDFTDAFDSLVDIELMCADEYLTLLNSGE